jgi:hypothetical protein
MRHLRILAILLFGTASYAHTMDYSLCKEFLAERSNQDYYEKNVNAGFDFGCGASPYAVPNVSFLPNGQLYYIDYLLKLEEETSPNPYYSIKCAMPILRATQRPDPSVPIVEFKYFVNSERRVSTIQKLTYDANGKVTAVTEINFLFANNGTQCIPQRVIEYVTRPGKYDITNPVVKFDLKICRNSTAPKTTDECKGVEKIIAATQGFSHVRFNGAAAGQK